jgi:hypothetical protein
MVVVVMMMMVVVVVVFLFLVTAFALSDACFHAPFELKWITWSFGGTRSFAFKPSQLSAESFLLFQAFSFAN